MTMAELFDALPPGWLMPPANWEEKPKRLARYFVVVFSMRVRIGETW
jgi:hypothetical protein